MAVTTDGRRTVSELLTWECGWYLPTANRRLSNRKKEHVFALLHQAELPQSVLSHVTSPFSCMYQQLQYILVERVEYLLGGFWVTSGFNPNGNSAVGGYLLGLHNKRLDPLKVSSGNTPVSVACPLWVPNIRVWNCVAAGCTRVHFF
jgi:hypothetical protein